MQFEFSQRAKEFQQRLRAFMDEHIYPNEEAVGEQLDAGPTRWKPIPLIEELSHAGVKLNGRVRKWNIAPRAA